MTAVVVVDDHTLTADTISSALRLAGVEATAVVRETKRALLVELIRTRPSVVLLDLDLGGEDGGAALVAPLAEAGIRVLLLTDRAQPMRVAAGLELGALGYHSKRDSFTALLRRVEQLLASPTPLDPHHRLGLLEALGRDRAASAVRLAPFQRLTDRERKTLLGLARGQSVTDMARDWVVSAATVRSHVRGVLTKLDAPSQLAAVARAVESGWLRPDGEHRGHWRADGLATESDAPAA